ncbi:S66 peptidase family protein [Myxacorys almedinensis]|uniref:LD-carboxypeptidase n=1 Tax=Myxacorys almedinensis A TaxID=2690445 RepID=A0A8J7YWE0_9CYAN|nr:LD-carboxypeptidase [Myxacorys almedinensis]NDJ15839.1 LD-carboxypeptidase [Myxacorys almedinensis A]
MKLCQLPSPLQPGDLLRVIAPSGALREMDAFHQGVDLWRQRGYRVELTAGYRDRWGYLAGTDDHRRAALETALSDPDCRGILCARGGWGGARLLEKWAFPPANPTWLIGFSDITSLLWAYAQEGVAGVHAPLLTTIAAEPDWSTQRLFDLVQGRPLCPLSGMGWGGGCATGRLLPGNLTVATHLLHTPWQPDLSDVILAIEDVTEFPYRIDRMLTQWRSCGALTSIRGIAIGRFSQCEPPASLPSFSVDEVLRDRLSDLNIPIVSKLPFGHDGENAALPVGVTVRLDGDRGILSF